MDEVATFSAQLEELVQELGRVQRALDAGPIDADLRKRVHVRFDVLINKQQRALQDLRDGFQPADLEQAWLKLKEIRRDCKRLFSESLDLLQGVLVRSAGLDVGICQIADNLMDDLRRRTDIAWSRLTIPGEAAFFGQIAEIIRVPFPEFSIWNLPLTGHEFGHLVAQELRVQNGGIYSYPFQELIDRIGRGSQTERFIHEYFADIFATYAHGPAYLCLAVVLRFDPVTAHVNGRDHPSATNRVGVMLATLDMMDESTNLPLYRSVRDAIGDLWHRSVSRYGLGRTLDPASVEHRWAADIYRLLERELPVAKYGGWFRAQRLAHDLRPYEDLPELHEDDALPDVLNAVWLWRLQHSDQTGDVYGAQRVDETARRLCELIAGRTTR